MKFPFSDRTAAESPKPESKVELLKSSIGEKMHIYSNKKNNNRNWALAAHMIIAILTASTTLLSGILEPGFIIGTIHYFEKDIRIGAHDIILCISALLFITNALMAFFNNRDGYTVFRKGLNQMRRLNTELDYYLLGNKSPDSKDLDKYLKQYMDIVQFVDSSHEEIRGSDTG